MNEAALIKKEAFEAFIATVDAAIRNDVETEAWQNAFSVETHGDYADDEERWSVALATARMVADAPADYGL